jgi:DNA-binding NarL/FixJ family response regulator
MSKIKVLIADDQNLVREGFKAMLRTQPNLDIVGEAANGQEAVEKTLQLRPDVVLMDIDMPVMDGIIATNQIKQANDQIQVLAVTGVENEDHFFQMLQVGGSGYVLKGAEIDELITAIRVAHQGEVFLSPLVAKTLVIRCMKDGTFARSSDSLTLREKEVLKLVAEGYTNKEIAKMLHLAPKTVETHRSNFMRKLDLHNRLDILRYAIRHGIIKV